jgi:UDPglucose 6-dehydrogenase
MSRVCVVGLWHLGSVAAACLADLGLQVTGIDRDAKVVENLAKGTPPLFEPGLEDMVKKNLAAGRLHFTSDMKEALAGAEVAWITYDTPVDEHDEVDLTPVLEAATAIAPHLGEGAVVLVSSQVPVGTCAEMAASIAKARPGLKFGVACSPENLRLGVAIPRFLEPDMFILGSDDAWVQDKLEALLAKIEGPKPRMSLKTAEMVKHAINSFLATCVAYAGEIAMACDASGADAAVVAKALRLDERIGPKARVLPGPGFSGGTLARDMRVLQHLGERHGYKTPFVDSALEVSDRQNAMAIAILEKAFGSLKGKTFGILGLTYTPNTSTLRRSMAIAVVKELAKRGATIRAFDPKADRAEVALHPEIEMVEGTAELANGAHALVLLTGWPEFKQIDFAAAKSKMERALLVDAQNMFEPEALLAAGWEYAGIGRGRGLTIHGGGR